MIDDKYAEKLERIRELALQLESGLKEHGVKHPRYHMMFASGPQDYPEHLRKKASELFKLHKELDDAELVYRLRTEEWFYDLWYNGKFVPKHWERAAGIGLVREVVNDILEMTQEVIRHRLQVTYAGEAAINRYNGVPDKEVIAVFVAKKSEPFVWDTEDGKTMYVRTERFLYRIERGLEEYPAIVGETRGYHGVLFEEVPADFLKMVRAFDHIPYHNAGREKDGWPVIMWEGPGWYAPEQGDFHGTQTTIFRYVASEHARWHFANEYAKNRNLGAPEIWDSPSGDVVVVPLQRNDEYTQMVLSSVDVVRDIAEAHGATVEREPEDDMYWLIINVESVQEKDVFALIEELEKRNYIVDLINYQVVVR